MTEDTADDLYTNTRASTAYKSGPKHRGKPEHKTDRPKPAGKHNAKRETR